MHIPDGLVSNSVNLATALIAAGFCAVAIARANRDLKDEQIPIFGVVTAFIFAAQMLNFPIAAGTSGHFLGAMFAAAILGPLNATLVFLLVLTVQCFCYADGGLLALGSNVLNMGVVGVFGAQGVFLLLKKVLPKTRGGWMASMFVASWFSVLAASLVCAVELGLSGIFPLDKTLLAMGSVHALIGLGEAVITTSALSLILGTRPDLVPSWKPREIVTA